MKSVYISQYEFATIIEEKPALLSQFKGKGRIINKFEIVVREAIDSKYDDIFLNFETCLESERKKLRRAYERIAEKIRRNVQTKKKPSHDIPNDKTFISSENYPTLVVYIPPPDQAERYIYILFFLSIFSREHLNG